MNSLLPCPLCGEPDPIDKGFGIYCRGCSLWLGDGTSALNHGGYHTLWNSRPAVKQYAEIRRQDGEIDEIAACGDIHIERLEGGLWFLDITNPETGADLFRGSIVKHKHSVVIFHEDEGLT